MLCVLIRIASTYHYCIEDHKDFPKLSPFASYNDAMTFIQWLELPMSQIYFYGPKDVPVIEIWW